MKIFYEPDNRTCMKLPLRRTLVLNSITQQSRLNYTGISNR